MTTAATATPAAPASTTQFKPGSFDFNWGNPGDRDRSVGGGGTLTVGPVSLSGNFVHYDKRGNSSSASIDFDNPNLKPGARGVMSYVKATQDAGGAAFVNDVFKQIEYPWQNHEKREFSIKYDVKTGDQVSLGFDLLGNPLKFEVGAQQKIQGEKRVHIERVDGNQVRVDLTQSYTVNKGFSVGGELLGFKPSASPGSQTTATQGISFTFDMNTDAGKEAYKVFLRDGVLPAVKDGKLPAGVTSLSETQGYSMREADGTFRSLTKTYNPLTRVSNVQEVHDNAQPGNADLTINRVFIGAPGAQKELVDKRTYTLAFNVAGEADAKALKTLDFSRAGFDNKAFDAIKPPTTLKFTMGEAQMKGLMQTAQIGDARYTQAEQHGAARRPDAAVGYGVGALLASNMPAADRSLAFAQLVAQGGAYHAGDTVASLRAYSDPAARSNATALQILAQTTDAASIRSTGPSVSGSLLNDGNAAPIAVMDVSAPTAGPRRH